MKRPFLLANKEIRAHVIEYIKSLPLGAGVTTDTDATRTLQQNAAQWPILQEFSRKIKWPVNGVLVTLSSEEWKVILTAAFNQESVRLAQGLDGGVVMLGMHTRNFSKNQFSEWLEFLRATAAMRGI